MEKRLFKVRRIDGKPVHTEITFFPTKPEAKKVRDELNREELGNDRFEQFKKEKKPMPVVVSPGPDHVKVCGQYLWLDREGHPT